jgi:hypothetical protein
MDSHVAGVGAQMSSPWPERTRVSRTELNPCRGGPVSPQLQAVGSRAPARATKL